MKIFVVLLGMGLTVTTWACEVCGCASTGPSVNLLGNTQQHAIGLGYSFRQFHSEHPSLFGHDAERSDEYFQTYSLIGKFQLSQRFHVLTIVPFVINNQQKSESILRSTGVSDLSVRARYAIIQRIDSINDRSWNILVGTGIKMPTGLYTANVHETTNLSPGTGSWDLGFELNAYRATKKWILSLENNYQLKTENPQGYAYGNTLQSQLMAYRKWSSNDKAISPGLGFQYEHLEKDRIHGSTSETFNSGQMVLGSIGLNLKWKQFLVVANCQVPMYQSLSKGYTQLRIQTNASLYFTF